MVLTLTLFATGTMIAGQVLAADWYDPDWGYRKMITIDSTKVPNTDRSNFPVLINTTDVDWRDTVNGGQVAQSDGGDILFTDSDGTTKLSHEIEKYSPSTGELVAWVNVPTVSASSDTDIFIYYGNATGGLAEWETDGSTWDNNFKGVWHFSEDPSGPPPQIKDSTSNNNDGTSGGSMTLGDQVAGQVDGSLDFDGSNDYIRKNPINNFPTTAITASCWMKSSDTIKTGTPISYASSAHNNDFLIYNYKNFIIFRGSSNTGGTSVTANDGNWHHITVTWKSSGGQVRIYKDGSQVYSGTLASGTSITGSGSLVIAQEQDNVGNDFDVNQAFKGIIDEVRISSTARSADWIKTSYNNQDSPSTFYTVGSEEALPDLIVSYLSIPKVRKNRRGHIARVFVDYRVVNQGDGDAVASELDFYLSRDTVLDGSDTYVGTVNIPSLASGEETHRLLNAKRFKLSRPVFSSGTWYLLGAADAGDDNVESDETNNVTSVLAAGSGR